MDRALMTSWRNAAGATASMILWPAQAEMIRVNEVPDLWSAHSGRLEAGVIVKLRKSVFGLSAPV
jgi:hypothetical protein